MNLCLFILYKYVYGILTLLKYASSLFITQLKR